jgi:ribonuclease P protein component
VTANPELRHETPLSAQQDRAQTPSRLPLADVHRRRAEGFGPAPGPWPQKAVSLTGQQPGHPGPGLVMARLKTRPDFLRAAKGIRRVAPSVTIEVCPSPETAPRQLRVGFTATRKLGDAVTRNRAKRRLRAAAAAVLPLYGQEGNDYVLVARQGSLTSPFLGLLGDLTTALHAAHIKLGQLTAREPQ